MKKSFYLKCLGMVEQLLEKVSLKSANIVAVCLELGQRGDLAQPYI